MLYPYYSLAPAPSSPLPCCLLQNLFVASDAEVMYAYTYFNTTIYGMLV